MFRDVQHRFANSDNARYKAIKASLLNWLRRDGNIIILYLLTTLVMTWPLIINLGQGWLAIKDDDTYVKLWDQWWLQHRLITDQPPYYTNDLFYPTGLDLSFHSISWTVASFSWLMTPLLGEIDAYNVNILLAVFATAYAAYLLIRPFVKHRAAAWVGGAIYSFAPYHVAHTAGHPDLAHLAPVPLAILLLMRAAKTGRAGIWLGTAFMIGIAAFTSLYILIFTLLTVGPVFLFLALAQGRWRESGFLKMSALLVIAASTLMLWRLWPIMQNLGGLSSALESKLAADASQTDLLAFIIPSQFNPIFKPFVSEIVARFNMNQKWPAYLGLIPLGLVLSAITWRKRRAVTLFWFGVGLFFLTLTLGTVLRYNGVVYNEIVLPANYLIWFPPIRAVGRPDFFVLGLLLPLAVCAAYGLERWLIALERFRQAQIYKVALIVTVSVLLLFEYWNGPYPGLQVPVSPFFTQLAQEEESFGLVQLPMGRQESKPYMYYQTIHQKPIVEGLSARTLPVDYRYVRSNLLLSRWRAKAALDCDTMAPDEIQAAIDQLAGDNFRYVIIHQEDDELDKVFASYFTNKPVYSDELISAYAITDLQRHPPCDWEVRS